MKVRTLFPPPTVAQGTAPTGGQQNNTSLKKAENHTHHQGFPNTNECTSVNEAQKGQRLMNASCLVCFFLCVYLGGGGLESEASGKLPLELMLQTEDAVCC